MARRTPLVALLVVVALTALVRVRLADVPLERDEGEYAYAGQLILEGVPPYRLAYNMKFPGTYYVYAAVLAIFGPSPRGIHLGLLAINAATIVAVFALARRRLGELAAVVAASAFAVLSLDRAVLGAFAHATHFVILPAVVGLLVLDRALDSRRDGGLFASGILLGIAVLMKQHAVFFLPLGAGLLVWSERREAGGSLRSAVRRLAPFGAGAVLPFAVMIGVFAAQGVLGRFWFWTFRYAGAYVAEVPVSEALPKLTSGFVLATRVAWPIWIAAAAGAVCLGLRPWTPRARAFVFGLAAASFLAVCPGFYFRNHYFVLMLPAAALLCGVAAATAERLLARRAVAAIVVLAASWYAIAERDYLFRWSPSEMSREIFVGNPFVESVAVAEYIRERAAPDDRIAVVGSEPQIYFYSRRRSATGYIYTYALMEPQPHAARMQDEMIGEIEDARPKFVVFVDAAPSWLARPTSDRRILDWASAYVRENYDLVGVAEIVRGRETPPLWDDAARALQRRPGRAVYTFRRRT